MDDLKNYFLSIILVAAICGICSSLVSKGSASGGLIRILTGVFLAITVISPLVNIRFDQFESYMEDVYIDGDLAAEAGADLAAEETAVIIKEELETYILEKAKAIGANITAAVILTDESIPRPQSVEISGSISPYNKRIMIDYIVKQLGIPEEQQKWN